ncbi:MAG: glutaredoxin family protein [Deltaproteobacteria bacterium]|nr:glutaredoxin family protein [Deltaproteobacteria bacterium]
MEIVRIEGRDKGKIMLYALSTCGWCRKTKILLNEMGLAYSYVDVDLLQGAERTDTLKEVQRWNPDGSFPTMVIDDSHCVVGFKEEMIRERFAEK